MIIALVPLRRIHAWKLKIDVRVGGSKYVNTIKERYLLGFRCIHQIEEDRIIMIIVLILLRRIYPWKLEIDVRVNGSKYVSIIKEQILTWVLSYSSS